MWGVARSRTFPANVNVNGMQPRAACASPRDVCGEARKSMLKKMTRGLRLPLSECFYPAAWMFRFDPSGKKVEYAEKCCSSYYVNMNTNYMFTRRGGHVACTNAARTTVQEHRGRPLSSICNCDRPFFNLRIRHTHTKAPHGPSVGAAKQTTPT